jgi:F-type H+-transporting ATPase subunit gamma
MAGLKQIKTKIVAMKKSQTVTRAMEAVSAAKMRKAQSSALKGRAYARASAAVLARVSGSKDFQSHPLAMARTVNKALYIVITSDKGLAGALNSGVLRAAAADIKESGLSQKQVGIIAVGRKAHDFFGKRGYELVGYHPNNADLSGKEMRAIVREAADLYAAQTVDLVKICYQNFVSTFEQRPTLRTVFPLSLDELNKVVGDIVPARGAYADQGKLAAANNPQVYTLEPSEVEVLNRIVPMLAGIIVYHALLESQASEHSARMVAMKSATDKAGELQHALTLQFNKARQAAITREVSEITGGMEAMAA